jgi:two-component system chemotaxis sensor kinase CheA
MATEDDKFLQRLLATFRVEAEEHLGTMTSLLQQLERGGAAGAAVESLFREAHSLKGAARAVNLGEVERVCQAMERALAALKRGEHSLSPPWFETLVAALDGLAQMLAPNAERPQGAAAALVRRLDALLAETPVAAAPESPPMARTEPPAPAALPDQIRIATTRLESLMTQAEELQPLKFSLEHLADELHAMAQAMGDWRRRWDKTARQARVLRRAGAAEAQDLHPQQRRALAQLLDGYAADELAVKALADRLARLERAAAQERRALSSRVDRLQAEMKQVLMLPLSNLTSGMGKLVRELARDSGKEVELVVQGASLEVDRRILEQMRTPLIHLLRNAVDHGIEAPVARLRAGKPVRGRIAIDIAPRDGNQLEIAIADDGAGIALDKVKARAARMGLEPPPRAEAADDARWADLVFESGLSTSPMLTDLSGHGLGLAIVREKVERLGGSVRAAPGEGGVGTTFSIVLPATLATFRGLLVQAGGRPFVLPSRNVERVGRVLREAVHAGPAGESVDWHGETLPLAGLAAALDMPAHARPASEGPHLQIVVLASGERRLAFVVDEVVGDQEVLVRPLAPPLRRVRNVSGATLLGAGRVVPLLNPADLLKSAQRVGQPSQRPHRTATASLLVADDSPTSRSLLKDILESAGYRVTTAADGLDALASLQAGDYDLLISDVEMPRLDGFGLTARLRTDRRLAELPVVLVTALDSREDKERGVEVGANAYIVKSGFDQRHLLDAIRTLL